MVTAKCVYHLGKPDRSPGSKKKYQKKVVKSIASHPKLLILDTVYTSGGSDITLTPDRMSWNGSRTAKD